MAKNNFIFRDITFAVVKWVFSVFTLFLCLMFCIMDNKTTLIDEWIGTKAGIVLLAGEKNENDPNESDECYFFH